MFGKFREEKTSIYDEPIAKVLESMKTFSPEDPEFSVLSDRLDELTKMKAVASPQSRIDPNVALTVAGHILGILTIVAYEQKHVMASKAVGFIHKLK